MLFLSISGLSQAQTYEVLYAKKVVDSKGQKVKKGSKLAINETISIFSKGEIELDIASPMNLRLGPGTYHLKKEGARLIKWYTTHLVLTEKLKREDLLMCRFRYKTIAVPGSDRHYEVDRIEIDQEALVSIPNDSTALTIKWHNPDRKFKGSYWVIFRDFFNHGFIDAIETEENTVTLYPADYGHKHMYYSVIAENCRASLRYRLEMVNFPSDKLLGTDFTK